MTEKRILVLGSGLVAKPCVDYLLRDMRNILTVACRTQSTAEKLVAGRDRATAVSLDVKSSVDLDRYVAEHDLVISLVPFVYHSLVIRSAIKGKTHVVTTSYVSPTIRTLDEAAKEAGIVVLNEVGMDPGVDHLYAVKVIDEVHEKGGKVKEFTSYCGGLPAPEAATNPLKFKFSWSPRGALLSQSNPATFLRNNAVTHIPNAELMASATPYPLTIKSQSHSNDTTTRDNNNPQHLRLVSYPNRDSTPFRTLYAIPEAHTVIRGTLRYEGNPALVRALIDLGWLSAELQDWLQEGNKGRLTWAEAQRRASGSKSAFEPDLVARVDEVCGGWFKSLEERRAVLGGLRWIGLFSGEVVEEVRGSLLDTLSARLERLCSFEEGERDLVVLQHRFVVEWRDGTTNTITSTLQLFGEPHGYSAMSKAVGVTCGIATQMLLDGFPPLNKPGVLAPYSKEICDPLREKVEAEGIKLVEERTPSSKVCTYAYSIVDGQH